MPRIFSASSSFTALSQHTWLIDSGASRHISHCYHFFHNWRRVSDFNAILPTSHRVSVDFINIGDIWLTRDILLRDDLYVPQLHYNLLSIRSLLLHNDISLEFDGDGVIHVSYRPNSHRG